MSHVLFSCADVDPSPTAMRKRNSAATTTTKHVQSQCIANKTAGDELNDIIDDHSDGSSFDAGLSDGVLTLKLGKHGT